MQISKLAKRTLKYLPILAVLVASVLGLFLGRNLYPISFDAQSKTAAPLSTEPDNLLNPFPSILGAEVPCGSDQIYTSLPPKCRATNGKLIPVPGTSPYFFAIPQGK